MQILFVDESGTPPPPDRPNNTPLFVLGGLVVPEDLWSKLATDLHTIRVGGLRHDDVCRSAKLSRRVCK